MKVFKLLRIGEHHINHCEDYLVEESLGDKRMLYAVMDGCTMGSDSYFASTLVGKLLRKIAREISYKSFYSGYGSQTMGESAKEILRLLFRELREVKNLVCLNDHELLSTLVLLVLDFSSETGYACVIGDGVVCINGSVTEYEQNNMPDYLGYHLGKDFDAWYETQRQVLIIDKIKDVSISTDGIFTFSKTDKQNYPSIDAVNYLLIDINCSDMTNMFDRKLSVIEKEYGLKATDDLGVIRIMNAL
jgi:hypothetical protein